MSSRRSDTEGDRAALVAVVLIVAALFGHCGKVEAQAVDLPPPEALEAQCAPTVPSNERRQTLTLDDTAGIWFHGHVARCMAARLALLPRYARHVRLLEERLAISDQRDALRAREVALATREADAAREALEAAVKRAREAEEARDAWYRHPVLLVSVGVVLTVALEVAAIIIIREVSP